MQIYSTCFALFKNFHTENDEMNLEISQCAIVKGFPIAKICEHVVK